jgi:hypothetical protein
MVTQVTQVMAPLLRSLQVIVLPPLSSHFLLYSLALRAHQMINISTSLFLREMQITTSMRYHFTPTRIARTKKKFKKENKCWQGYGEKIGSLVHC